MIFGFQNKKKKKNNFFGFLLKENVTQVKIFIILHF